MGYEIIVQDFALPLGIGAGYLPGINLYSDCDYIQIEENPHELFEGTGMGRISTNKCEYEAEPAEFYQDMTSESEDYIPEEEEEIEIVSWIKEGVEDILMSLEENAASQEMMKEHGKDPANEDFF